MREREREREREGEERENWPSNRDCIWYGNVVGYANVATISRISGVEWEAARSRPRQVGERQSGRARSGNYHDGHWLIWLMPPQLRARRHPRLY